MSQIVLVFPELDLAWDLVSWLPVDILLEVEDSLLPMGGLFEGRGAQADEIGSVSKGGIEPDDETPKGLWFENWEIKDGFEVKLSQSDFLQIELFE